MEKGVVPANTKGSNEWALKNLHAWVSDCNARMSDEAVPDDLLACEDADTLCKWMCCFVQETRKENGENYPPSTLRLLLAAFQQILHMNKVNLFDKSDLRFRDLHNTLDSVCNSKDGIQCSQLC